MHGYNNNNNNNNNNKNTIEKAIICYSSDYIRLTNLYFCMNKWHYWVLLIQLLKVLYLKNYKFVHLKWLKNKQNLVKSHSLISKWITKKKKRKIKF